MSLKNLFTQKCFCIGKIYGRNCCSWGFPHHKQKIDFSTFSPIFAKFSRRKPEEFMNHSNNKLPQIFGYIYHICFILYVKRFGFSSLEFIGYFWEIISICCERKKHFRVINPKMSLFGLYFIMGFAELP